MKTESNNCHSYYTMRRGIMQGMEARDRGIFLVASSFPTSLSLLSVDCGLGATLSTPSPNTIGVTTVVYDVC